MENKLFEYYSKLYPSRNPQLNEFDLYNAWVKTGTDRIPSDLRYQVLNYHEEHFNLLRRILESHPLQSSFSIGIFNIKNFNASIDKVDNVHIILLDEQLIGFYTELFIALLHLSYKDYNESIKRECKQHIDSLFLNFNNTFHEKDKLICDILPNLDEYFVFESGVCSYAVLYFLFGHELGHHYHGHLETPSLFRNDLNKKEFDADNYALQGISKIITEIRPNNNTNVSAHFIRSTELMFDILDIYYSKYAPNSNYHSHPHPRYRKERVTKFWDDTIGEEGKQLYNDLYDTLIEYTS